MRICDAKKRALLLSLLPPPWALLGEGGAGTCAEVGSSCRPYFVQYRSRGVVAREPQNPTKSEEYQRHSYQEGRREGRGEGKGGRTLLYEL
eukprot:9484902-Pyramimonas_sp.AAC.2